MKPTIIEQHDLLERKANIMRRRLMNTVDELEARKHTLEREAVWLLPIAAAALGTFLVMAQRWNVRRRRRAQWRRLLRAVHLH